MSNETTTVPPALSLPQRIWGVFVSPGIVFENLKHHPSFWPVLLLLIVINLGTLLLLRDVMVEIEMAKLADNPGVTQEQLDKQADIMRVWMPVAGTLFSVVAILVMGGLFLFLSNVVLGGTNRFKHAISAVAHINLVTIPAVIVRAPLTLMQREQVETSLAAFLPEGPDAGFLYHLLNQFDIFMIWMLILGVIALSTMTGSTLQKAGFAVGAIWVVFLLVAAAFSAFAQNIGGS